MLHLVTEWLSSCVSDFLIRLCIYASMRMCVCVCVYCLRLWEFVCVCVCVCVCVYVCMPVCVHVGWLHPCNFSSRVLRRRKNAWKHHVRFAYACISTASAWIRVNAQDFPDCAAHLPLVIIFDDGMFHRQLQICHRHSITIMDIASRRCACQLHDMRWAVQTCRKWWHGTWYVSCALLLQYTQSLCVVCVCAVWLNCSVCVCVWERERERERERWRVGEKKNCIHHPPSLSSSALCHPCAKAWHANGRTMTASLGVYFSSRFWCHYSVMDPGSNYFCRAYDQAISGSCVLAWKKKVWWRALPPSILGTKAATLFECLELFNRSVSNTRLFQRLFVVLELVKLREEPTTVSSGWKWIDLQYSESEANKTAKIGLLAQNVFLHPVHPVLMQTWPS